MKGVSALIKESLALPHEDRGRRGHHVAPDADPASILVVGFPASRPGRSQCLLSTSPLVCGVLL